jgi:hypothetical protein
MKKMTQSEVSLSEIENLDLVMVKRKLMDPEEGEGWSAELCDLVEREYHKFLALTRAYPELAIVPSGLVDKFWHNHILDTQKYGPDCLRIFGFFLHHFPYFGMRGAEDAANLHRSWDNTIEVYRRHFGEPPVGLWDSGARCPKCGRLEPFAMIERSIHAS